VFSPFATPVFFRRKTWEVVKKAITRIAPAMKIFSLNPEHFHLKEVQAA
jgi:hypothetical protein